MLNLIALDTPKMPFEPGDDLASIIARVAARRPEAVALVDGDRRVTWSSLAPAIARTAGALLGKPRARGDRVAMLGANSVEYVEAFFGTLHAGLCAVPLPTLASKETLALMLEDCGARVLFASAAYRDVAEDLIRGRRIEGVGFDFESDAFERHASFVAGGSAIAPVLVSGSDPFDVIYSSGTTGVPKGIVHSHAARKASYAGSRASYFSETDVNIVATPFYSNTTCVTWFIATARGGTNVILGKFSPDAFLRAVEQHHVTHAMLVPVQYDRILESERFAETDVSSLRYLFSTSAPLRAETKRKILERTRADLVEIYGLTEGGPVTVLEGRKHPDKLASVGKPSPGIDVRVVDEAGAPVPSGQAGEVIGRSSNMMDGYLNRAEDTNAMLFRTEGMLFFKTGDLGRFDEDGFLYLLDRKKDVIISGGFNVYATDLEAVILRHPAVSEATVIGIPSARWGETPIALVVLRPEAAATPEELLAFCNERVGKVQRLHAVEIRSELPKNAIGKILKRELRAPYWKDQA